MFGEECVHYKDKNCLAVSVDEKTAYINLETRVSIKLCEVYTPKFYGNGSILILVVFLFFFRPCMRNPVLKMILSEKWWSSLCRDCMKPWTLSCEIGKSHLPSIRLFIALKNFCYYSPSNYLNQTEATRNWTGQSTSKDWIAIKSKWKTVKASCWYVHSGVTVL